MIEEYTSIAKKAIFKGEGFVEIFSADGNYISKSKHKNSLMSEWDNMWNFFKSVEFEEGYSYETLHQDITEGKSGQIRYKIYGKERIAHYMPMDIKDWYTFVIIPKEAIGEYTGNINNTMSFLLAFILISFIILIVIVILYELKVRKELVKINEEVKISKERFAIAINLTGSLVIEYDIEKKSILHFSEKSEEYGIKKDEEVTLEKLLSLGIFDDEYIRDAENIFRRIEEGDEMSVGVVKAKKKDGRSCWVKISFTTLYDSNGKPIKGIGTLEDITDSKVIELLYLQEEQNRIAIMADTVETYIFDVTENKFLYGFRNNGERFEQNNKSYDSIINKVAKENIYKEDKELFLSAFKRENIKKEFSEGKVKIAIEYRKGNKEDFKWFEGIINLFLDSESGNLLGGLYVRDINEKKSKEISLRYDAERDQLTGIYNRRMTENSIIDTLKDNSERRVHALFSIDLDGFKSVNDSHGHMIGDELLIEMARELRGILRKGDILGRMGGDEFIILLKDIKDKKQIELKANEICNTLRSLKIIKRENLNVSGSVGISISPMDGTNFSELYKKADEALYVAKNAGKDQYVIYDDSIKS
ncbi:diguanylate cyclase domain-containing protein [Clostridium sp. LP20]|uniref:diguanylate cyclase domain-containing protein n=1 Tax=Clostridium sp. LP20 TaxID=3418665 RepID=UPI003EE75857